MRGCIDVEQGVECITLEVVDGTGEFSVPEAEVDTGIPLLVSLPLAILVNLCEHCCTKSSSILNITERVTVEHFVTRAHSQLECIGANSVVTHLTVTGTNLQVVEPAKFKILHKRLFGKSPSKGHRREEAPRLLGKLTRCIGTEVECYHVTAIITIERTPEE